MTDTALAPAHEAAALAGTARSPASCPACGAASARPVDRADAAVLADGYRRAGLATIDRLLPDRRAGIALHRCAACDLLWYAGAAPGDAAFYEELQQHPWYYQAEKPEYAFARGHLRPGDAVLEVGCGRGAFGLGLPPGVRWRGLEFNRAACEAARAAGLDVEMRPLADEARERPGAYDVVCHFQVLEHVSDPAGFLRDSAAALRPGGRLIVAVPSEDSFVGLAESAWLNMPPHHLTRWSDRALENAFRSVGVEPGESWHEPVAAYHRDWQREVMLRAGWLDLLGRRPNLVAGRAGLGTLRALRRAGRLGDALVRRGLAAWPQGRRGHTVCLVGVRRDA